MIEKVFFAISSVLVFEGFLLAVIPTRIKKALEVAGEISPTSLSRIGLISMGIGIILMWVVKI